jgi:hypothetical protein
MPLNGDGLHVNRWTAETRLFTSKTSQPVALALRLINYPAWEIQVDRKTVGGDSETAQLSLEVPAGEHSVSVQFRRSWDRTAGSAISIFSAFLLLGFSFSTRRKTSHVA